MCTIQWCLGYLQSCTAITIMEIQVIFSIPKRKPVPRPHCPASPSPQQALVYFVSVDLPILDILYKQNCTTCGLLCLAPSTQHFVLKVHTNCSIRGTLFLFMTE